MIALSLRSLLALHNVYKMTTSFFLCNSVQDNDVRYLSKIQYYLKEIYYIGLVSFHSMFCNMKVSLICTPIPLATSDWIFYITTKLFKIDIWCLRKWVTSMNEEFMYCANMWNFKTACPNQNLNFNLIFIKPYSVLLSQLRHKYSPWYNKDLSTILTTI